MTILMFSFNGYILRTKASNGDTKVSNLHPKLSNGHTKPFANVTIAYRDYKLTSDGISTGVQTVPRQLFIHHHNNCSFITTTAVHSQGALEPELLIISPLYSTFSCNGKLS